MGKFVDFGTTKQVQSYAMSLAIMFMITLPSCKTAPNKRLLNPPEQVSRESVDKKLHVMRTTPGYSGDYTGNNKSYHYIANYEYATKKTYFIIEYFDKLPDEFSDSEKDMFTLKQKEIDGVTTDVYVYTYGPVNEKKSDPFKKPVKQTIRRKIEHSFKRDFSKTEPKPDPITLSIEECATLVKENKVIFLTGAGISIAAGIPTQQAKEKEMGIEYGKPVNQFIKNWLHNPKKNIEALASSYEPIFTLEPTPAHHALAQLAFHKQAQILTGNFDMLHEKSGIKAVQIKDSVEEDLTQEVAEQVDAIVCIGSRDDFGAVLGRYKRLNPLGLIIAINKEQPDYIGNEDFFVQGDVQELVPRLAELVIGGAETKDEKLETKE
jgi:NAD-dependent SIR2 family protein deacetylase